MLRCVMTSFPFQLQECTEWYVGHVQIVRIKMNSYGHGLYLPVLLIFFYFVLDHGTLTFLWQKATHLIVGWFSQATHGKITVNGIPNCLNYCKIFVFNAQFINVAVVHITKPGRQHGPCGPQVGDPCLRLLFHCRKHSPST